MKTIYTALFATALAIICSAGVAEARTNWEIVNDDDGFTANVFGNKYCANADSPLTDAEIDITLRAHNETRQAVGLEPLKWNCALAEFAQKWANTDTGNHSTEQQRKGIVPGDGAGENLAHGFDSETPVTVQSLIQGWIDEKQYLQSDRKTCTPNPKNIPCGHYTQMVWRTTTEVGCGIIRKSNSFTEDSKGKASYLVCIYNPGGNMDGVAAY
jgi:pathogenesis-related protein 1